MSKYRKWIAAAVICGGFVVSWKVMTATIVLPPQNIAARALTHSDSFADYINHKVTSVTRLDNHHAHPVIFDNDAADDDALALVLIGNDPGVDLQAITVAGTGEAHGLQGAINMATIAALMGKTQVPVAFGRAEPLSRAGKPFPSFLREHSDNMMKGANITTVAAEAISGNAVGLIHQVVAASKEKVTILATGPLTNVAEFVKQYPELKAKVEKIVVMGGALKVPGNIEKLVPDANNKVSEWNFYADPAAAHVVFASGIPITLVALDATNQVPMTRQFYEAIQLEDQPDMRFVHHVLKAAKDRAGDELFYSKYYLWDPLAAMVMIDPTIAETTVLPLSVDINNGQIKVSAKGGAKVNMVTTVIHPDIVLRSYVALVKSNHIFAQRKFYQDPSRNRMRADA